MKTLIKRGKAEILVNDYQAEMLLRVAPRDYDEKIEPVTEREDTGDSLEVTPEREDRSADRFQSQRHEISGFTTGTESPAIPGVAGLPKRGRPAKVKE